MEALCPKMVPVGGESAATATVHQHEVSHARARLTTRRRRIRHISTNGRLQPVIGLFSRLRGRAFDWRIAIRQSWKGCAETGLIQSIVLAAALLVCAGVSNAFAWGCDGHSAIAIIAEQMLGPKADPARRLLAAAPVDPKLKRFCDPVPSDIIADVSTWADDVRAVDPTTAGWHFIDFPRAAGIPTADPAKYCARGSCVVAAIVEQFNILTTATDPKIRANALRFVIHLVGDIHQPLHAITNGDRGGNCIPVSYFGQLAREDENGAFTPNLHRVWDTDAIRVLMKDHRLADTSDLASYVVGRVPQKVSAQAPTLAQVTSWARASNALARTVAYGKLPVLPPLEPIAAVNLTSCTENNHVGRRMAELDERLGSPYQRAIEPTIVNQLWLAGEHLASVLQAAFAGDR
jgi:nuclease S1